MNSVKWRVAATVRDRLRRALVWRNSNDPRSDGVKRA